jgi:hypothetical protein
MAVGAVGLAVVLAVVQVALQALGAVVLALHTPGLLEQMAQQIQAAVVAVRQITAVLGQQAVQAS